MIGSVAGRPPFEVRKLSATRLHTRTIIRDGRQAFVGSQSLQADELDSRRELGLIVQDAKAVASLVGTFEADWAGTKGKKTPARPVTVLAKRLDPMAVSVRKAVKDAVAKAGKGGLGDKAARDTMKQVVKKAMKEGVKEGMARG